METIITSSLCYKDYNAQVINWMVESEDFYASKATFKIRLIYRLMKRYREGLFPHEELKDRLNEGSSFTQLLAATQVSLAIQNEQISAVSNNTKYFDMLYWTHRQLPILSIPFFCFMIRGHTNESNERLI